MTEAEWLACTNPQEMLVALRSRKVSERKLRLFFVGCARAAWDLIGRDDIRRAVGDGRALRRRGGDRGRTRPVQQGGVDAACEDMPEAGEWFMGMDDGHTALRVAFAATLGRQGLLLLTNFQPEQLGRVTRDQPALLRDVAGPLPFRPIAADPRWLTSTAVALAQAIYEERAFDRLPILADALEEAGCDHADLLAHCRGDGPHVRGCWAVDLVLGKE